MIDLVASGITNASEIVSARRLAPEQLCAHDTQEAIADWHYWVARGYLL
jgi:hypothetical protein